MRSEDLDDLLEDMERWRAEGEACIAHGEPARALVPINRALRRDPPRSLASQLYILKSRALEQLGLTEQALEAAERAVDADDMSALARMRRAAVYSALGRTAESEADCAAAVRLEADNAYAWMMWGNRLDTLGRAAEALNAVEQSLEIDSMSRAAWQEKGIALHGLGRYDEALVAYKEALRLSGEDAQARAQVMLNMAMAQREAGRHEERLGAARAATQLDPTLASAFLEQSDALRELGRHAEAVDVYRQRIRLEDNNTDAWLQLGGALERVDRPAEAAEAYAQAIALDPTHAEAHYWRGRALARTWLTIAEHSEEEQAQIDADPDAQEAQVWLDEGRIHESRREWSAALRGAEEALSRAPANTAALGLKVRILLRRRQFRDAFAAFRQRLAYDRQLSRKRRMAKSRPTQEDGR